MFIVLYGAMLFVGARIFEKSKTRKKKNGPEDGESRQAAPAKPSAELTKDTPASLPVARERVFSEAQIDTYLAVSSVSTTLTSIGILAYPPLIPMAMMGLLYPLVESAKRAYKGFAEEGKVKQEALEILVLPGMILTGYYFTASFSYWLYHLSLKLLSKIEDRTSKNLVGMFENQPRSVWIVRNGLEIEIPFDALQSGDLVSVKAGEAIPADGLITAGRASVDQHLLTGEAQPLEKEPGDLVFASTVVLAGHIQFRVEKSGQETVVAHIVDLLNRTVDYKTTVQSTGERVSDQVVLPTLACSALALPVTGPTGTLAVLSSYIGWDIRILAPLGTMNYLKIAAQHSILIKDGRALELLTKADTVVFDKTGTLTLEQPHVWEIHPCRGYQEVEVLQYAAIAEHRQTHPIARAILEKAREYAIPLAAIDDASYRAGYGITVTMSGNSLIQVGSARFMDLEGIEIPQPMQTMLHDCLDSGHALIMVAKDHHLIGAIELHATVRPEIRNIISRLQQRGKSLYILSGDHEKPTRMLAGALGIEHYFAETFPQQKAQIIEQLQQAGQSVCFIGDGINDTIAMKKAQVSISLRGASTVATDTANIVLLDGTLNHLDKLFELAEDQDHNLHVALATAIVPGVINIGSVFLFHTGIYFSIGLYYLALPIGLANAFLPRLKYHEPEKIGG